MQPLKPWSMLIAIASVLFLSVAGNAHAQSPSPHPAEERDGAAAEHQATANPVSTLRNQGSPKATPESIKNYSYSYNYYRPSSESPPVWFQVTTTIVLLAFTCGLWFTSVRQWRIARDTLYQVQRGRISLHAIEVLWEKDVQFIRIRFKNIGNGPVFTKTISWSVSANGTGDAVDEYKLGESLTGGQETRWWRIHTPSDYTGPDGGKELIVQGQLFYIDGFKADHVTGFRRAYRKGQFEPDGGEQYNYEK